MIALLELLVVTGIFSLQIVELYDQLKTNKFQREYWKERRDFFARRLVNPPKQKQKAQQTSEPAGPGTKV